MKKLRRGWLLKALALTVAWLALLPASKGQQPTLDTNSAFLAVQHYDVANYARDFADKRPQNIILMIGDGMGVSHIFAGLTANKGSLFLENFKNIGFSKTQSRNNYITDSAAGGTALATGEKTYNGAVGMVVNAHGDTVPAKTIVEIAEENGLSTGIVASCALSHATPGSFIAHQPRRNMYDAIAADYLTTDIDVFIGGGYKNFADRADKRDLIAILKAKGYQVARNMEEINRVDSGKLAGITAYAQNEPVPNRELDLPLSTQKAITLLNKNATGFFLMVEGSQIDWGAHENRTGYVVREMLDFDQAIGQALAFAYADSNTLIVVTADHETGGMALTGGDIDKGWVKAEYVSGGHTGVMVPIFAYGPGADQFTGIMENTDIAKKIISFIND